MRIVFETYKIPVFHGTYGDFAIKHNRIFVRTGKLLRQYFNKLNNPVTSRCFSLIFLFIIGCTRPNDELEFANGFSDIVVKINDSSQAEVHNIIFKGYDDEKNYMGELILNEKRDTLYFEDHSFPEIVIRRFYENNMISRKEESVRINGSAVSNLKTYYKQGRIDIKTSSFLEIHNKGAHFEVCFSVPGCDSAYFFKSKKWLSAFDMEFNPVNGVKADNNCFDVNELDDTCKGVIVLYKTLKSDSTGTDIARRPIYINSDILRFNLIE